MKFRIRLENAKEAEEFVNAAAKCGGDVNLHSGVVYIDGKSLLGVLAMGIKRELSVHTSIMDASFEKSVSKFIVA